MKKLSSLAETLKLLPKAVPGTNTIMQKLGFGILGSGIASALRYYFDDETNPIETYYICGGFSILGLAVAIIDYSITKNNISKFDSSFNKKTIYFEDQRGNIMKTMLNTQYIQGITQCDVKFTYEQPECCTIEEIEDILS